MAEETPVNEVVETAFHLEDRAGVQLAPVVVNGLFPPVDLDVDVAGAARAAGVALSRSELHALSEAAAFRRHRQGLQEIQVSRLADALPLPQLHLPFLFTTELEPSDLDRLADSLTAEIGRLPAGGSRP